MGPEQLHGGTGQREDSAGVKEHRKIAQPGAQEGTALADGLKGESAVEAWLLACQAAETQAACAQERSMLPASQGRCQLARKKAAENERKKRNRTQKRRNRLELETQPASNETRGRAGAGGTYAMSARGVADIGEHAMDPDNEEVNLQRT